MFRLGPYQAPSPGGVGGGWVGDVPTNRMGGVGSGEIITHEPQMAAAEKTTRLNQDRLNAGGAQRASAQLDGAFL